MSMVKNAGELRTRIRIQRYVEDKPPGQQRVKKVWIDLGNDSPEDAPRYIRCAWSNIHGSDVWAADQALAQSGAAVTVRYRPDITVRCRVLKGDGTPYEIISADNIRERGQFIVLSVKRMVSG